MRPFLILALLLGFAAMPWESQASPHQEQQEPGTDAKPTSRAHPELAASPSLATPLTLEKVVALALGQNPGLKAQEERSREVDGGIREARADAFPQLKLNSGWNIARDPSLLNSEDFEDIVASFPGGAFEPARQQLYNITTELSQPLFTWGKLGAAIKLAHKVSEITTAQVDSTKLDVALEATEAFYEILAAQQQVATLESQRDLRREELSVVETRLDLGDATRLEMLRAKAALAQVSPALETARGNVMVGISQLRRVLSLPRQVEVEVSDPPGPLPQPPAPDALLREALRTRPEIKDLQEQISALDLRIRIVRSDGKPRLDLTGSYGRTVRLAEDLGDHRFRDWRFALDFRWDFFDGGRRRGQIEQFESQQRQLHLQQQDLENRVQQDIDGSLARLTAARARLRAAELSAEASREAVRVAEESYGEGVALQVDLLNARDQMTEALLEQNQAYFDARTRWAQLLRATGRLPTQRFQSTRSNPTPQLPSGAEGELAP